MRYTTLALVVFLAGCAILRDSDVDLDSDDAGTDHDASVTTDTSAPAVDAGDEAIDAGGDVPDANGGQPDAEVVDEVPGDWWDEAWRSRVVLRGDWDRAFAFSGIPLPIHWNKHAAGTLNARDTRVVLNGAALPYYIQETPEGSVIWTRVETLEPRTELAVYWDNPEAFDESDPAAVWTDYTFVDHFDGENENVAKPTASAAVMGAPTAVAGVVGSAWDFGADLARIEYPRDPDYGVADGEQYTFEVWTRSPSGPADEATFMDHEGLCDGIRFRLETDLAPTLFFSLGNECEDYQRARIRGAPLAPDEWHYIAATIDRVDNRMVAFVNGARIGEEELVRMNGGVGYDLYFGANIGRTEAHEGAIDEPRIYRGLRAEDYFPVRDALARDMFFVWEAPETLP